MIYCFFVAQHHLHVLLHFPIGEEQSGDLTHAHILNYAAYSIHLYEQ